MKIITERKLKALVKKELEDIIESKEDIEEGLFDAAKRFTGQIGRAHV